MSKHTGGWVLIRNDNGVSQNIALVPCGQKHNADLIAAAPDLLEAVQRLLGWDTFSTPTGRARDDANFARAAIAKAMGDTP